MVNVEYARFSGVMDAFQDHDSISDRAKMDAKSWWLVHGVHAPMLQDLALKLLGQPCSSSCCERNWSTYFFIHSMTRNKITPQRAQDLVFVHSNLRLLTRRTPQYHQGESKMWDVGGDAFGYADDVGMLGVASLSLDEPEMEVMIVDEEESHENEEHEVEEYP
ncbi:uncharacterized protein LOC119986268 [Tripterygium wilfordii]|uniref:uncharacterized protein LOC119986268 n=1 Tax=Tripterygium wilfordii TaxID=458696 RepID=UPI0018F7FD10|nr:uncharacterized protein LOC119986268 [Tripterygium wilfordii]